MGVVVTIVEWVRLRNILCVIFGGIDTNNLELAKQAGRKMSAELQRIKPDGAA